MAGVATSLSSHDLSPSVEAGEGDTGTASFFNTEYKKHGDLREMLDSSKDNLKLDAMKRLVAMMAKGRDVSDLFPQVVKNVASKNIEVKKLVYVYLTRYAEEQQDLALLSISTFQRALKDPNQLIRASALRVLSSIRVPMIVPIMLLAIKESAVDMSPFVRKTAAHAIPKLYSLEPDTVEELVGVLEKLLGDRTTLVIGSAVMAYEEVCPDRIDLIHKNYRKLVSLLVDVEEWGQVVIVNMLTRYARTQFADPNLGAGEVESEKEKEFYENSDEEEEEEEEESVAVYKMDADHRLLLRSARPLLQSRNASVVMATAQLYWHLAPRQETTVVARALVRLLRSHNEVQSVVLSCVASMTAREQGGARMFQPFLRQMFVRGSDPTHVTILKLEILTNLASESNIGGLLREFQSYISAGDPVCVAATIQAIGRCAATIGEVTDTCLSGLVHLLSSKEPAVVAESVVEIKKLLQTQASDHRDIIAAMARLVDSVEVGSARAAILWVVGEYCTAVPTIAPDVLRKMAKSFCQEEDQVKLQVLNLAVKLFLTNPKQTTLLTQYVLNLAKYDMNYDIRDRARFLRAVLLPQGEPGAISRHARKIFLAAKPAPTLESRGAGREVFMLGSLSHYMASRAAGYQDLPTFPTIPPDPAVRTVEVPKPAENPWKKDVKEPPKKDGKKTKKPKDQAAKFYESDASDKMDESQDSDPDSSSSSSSSSSDSESEEDVAPKIKTTAAKPQTKPQPKPQQKPRPKPQQKPKAKPAKPDSSSSSSSSEGDAPPPAPPAPRTNLSLLLDLEETPPTLPTPVLTPSLGGLLSPTPPPSTAPGQPMHLHAEPRELLNKLATGGVQVGLRFTRQPHLYSPTMVALELTFTNLSSEEVSEVKVGGRQLPPGMALHEFPALLGLQAGQARSATLGVDYNDTTQAARVDLVVGGRAHAVALVCPTGEMVRPLVMAAHTFALEQAKLRGMNESSVSAALPSTSCDLAAVTGRLYRVANLLQVPGSEAATLHFAGETVSGRCLVLVTLDLGDSTAAAVTVNTERLVLGSMLAKEIKAALEKE